MFASAFRSQARLALTTCRAHVSVTGVSRLAIPPRTVCTWSTSRLFSTSRPVTSGVRDTQPRTSNKAKNTLFVGNLPYSAEEREIREKFEPFGEIQAIKIAYRPDGTARGFAHVEFVHEADAAGALASASEEPVYLLDRDLRVDFAARRDRPSDSGEPTHSLYFHGLRGGESVLRDAIRPFRSSIVNTHFLKNRETGEETGAGFIQFMSTERATEALRELNGLQLEDNETLSLRYAYPKRTRADEPYDGARRGGSRHGGGGERVGYGSRHREGRDAAGSRD